MQDFMLKLNLLMERLKEPAPQTDSDITLPPSLIFHSLEVTLKLTFILTLTMTLI